MKKTYSESQLKDLAQTAFEQYPNAKQVFATEDGQCFLMLNRAELHAGPKGKVYPFERETSEKVIALNAKDTIAAIKATETLEGLEVYKADERVSVVEAYNKRKVELTVVVGAEQVQPEPEN